jgi:hypothetical protein
MKRYVLAALIFSVLLLATAVATRIAREAGAPGFITLALHIGGLAAMFYGTRAAFRANHQSIE